MTDRKKYLLQEGSLAWTGNISLELVKPGWRRCQHKILPSGRNCMSQNIYTVLCGVCIWTTVKLIKNNNGPE